jgi:hypothetical protein
MTRTIRLQSDSNAHDRPWRVAVEQGFFAAEGLTVEYHEDNPKGTGAAASSPATMSTRRPQPNCAVRSTAQAPDYAAVVRNKESAG